MSICSLDSLVFDILCGFILLRHFALLNGLHDPKPSLPFHLPARAVPGI